MTAAAKAPQTPTAPHTPELALFGAAPTRSAPFAPSVWTADEERAAILAVVERGVYSRYAGGPVPDVETHLRLSSAAALDADLPYWNVLGGPEVRALEAEVADSLGLPYAVAVNSATTGLVAALQAAGVGAGDEVITTPVTFTATAASIVLANAVPVFADVDPRTGNLSPAAVAAACTPRTKAVLLVHLLGNPGPAEQLAALCAARGLSLIEDCAQSPGCRIGARPVGSLGRFSVFSLQQTKNVMAGEGGLVLTHTAEDARRLRLCRNHGEAIVDGDGEIAGTFGSNYRMTELTAALARVQWRRLAESNRIRRDNADYLWARLPRQGLRRLEPSEGDTGVPHVLALDYDAAATGVPRALLADALRAEGVPVGTGYAAPLYLQPMYQRQRAYGDSGCPFRCPLQTPRSYPRGLCPEAEVFLARALWVFQIYAPLTHVDMDDIARAFERVWRGLPHLQACGDVGGKRHIDR